MRFRKKPIEVEAMQWDGTAESGRGIENWANNLTANYTVVLDKIEEVNRGDDGKKYITTHYKMTCRTLEGWLNVSPMDWLIRGVKGEFYPCKPDIFEATYEPVTT